MAVTQISMPNTITDINVEIEKSMKLALNFADGSKRKSKIKEKDNVDLKYVKDGKLLEINGIIVNILGVDPSYSLLLDSSSTYSATRICIPVMSIRDIINITDPDSNEYVEPTNPNPNPIPGPTCDDAPVWQTI